VQSFIEREGSFTSGERRVQRFYSAVAPFHGPRPDFRIASDLAKRLGQEIEGRAVSLLMAQIAQQISDYAGVTYPGLAEVHDQWPIVHREDLFYGGTSYQNRSGLGIQLPLRNFDPATTSWPEQKAPVRGIAPNTLQLVPVTRLYDRGTTVTPSQLLHARLAHPEIYLHPGTAASLNISNNDQVVISLGNGNVTVQVKLDETLPEGVALVTRSTGIPLSAPQAVLLQRLAQEAASVG
jgi:NADH-quinone oxidoreductase subunit G